MKRLVVACAFLLALTTSAHAGTQKKQLHSTVGFTAGATTGLGLTYRGAMDGWFGQLALMPAWNKEDGGSVFAGTQFGKRIQGDDNFYLNVAIGLGAMYSQGEECEWVDANPPPGEDYPNGYEDCYDYENTYLAGGPSIGLGKVWGEHLHGEIYIPIAAVWKLGSGLEAVVPYPGITLGYRW